MMRRIRNISTPFRNGGAKGKVSQIQIDYSGPSFSDLPNNTLVTILLRLPVKRILICKCVCKTLYHLISDPEFAKLHFNQAQVYPLLQFSGFKSLSRIMLYLMEPERDDFERNLEMCNNYDPNSPIKIELDSNLKLPLRNIQTILDKEKVKSTENCMIMKLNMKNHKYNIVNSCNGLLCLSNPSDNEPLIVCNPVTREFINLPKIIDLPKFTDFGTKCGFGFSPATGQYKVLRMFRRRNKVVAEVYILGTETWRVLPSLPESIFVSFPTYLNGCVYWLSDANPHFVICFDIEKECFESISVPTLPISRLSMGVLGEELFISAFQIRDILRFWVMKDNGANKSWSQIYSFQVNDDEKWPSGSYQPIKYLSNGELLMFNSYKQALICKDPTKTGFRYLKVHGFNYEVEAIPHIPSFIPLKDALSGGHDMTVLNLNSRCAELKLHGEGGQVISIMEEDINSEELCSCTFCKM